jgi:hypothetical protein
MSTRLTILPPKQRRFRSYPRRHLEHSLEQRRVHSHLPTLLLLPRDRWDQPNTCKPCESIKRRNFLSLVPLLSMDKGRRCRDNCVSNMSSTSSDGVLAPKLVTYRYCRSQSVTTAIWQWLSTLYALVVYAGPMTCSIRELIILLRPNERRSPSYRRCRVPNERGRSSLVVLPIYHVFPGIIVSERAGSTIQYQTLQSVIVSGAAHENAQRHRQLSCHGIWSGNTQTGTKYTEDKKVVGVCFFVRRSCVNIMVIARWHPNHRLLAQSKYFDRKTRFPKW